MFKSYKRYFIVCTFIILFNALIYLIGPYVVNTGVKPLLWVNAVCLILAWLGLGFVLISSVTKLILETIKLKRSKQGGNLNG